MEWERLRFVQHTLIVSVISICTIESPVGIRKARGVGLAWLKALTIYEVVTGK